MAEAWAEFNACAGGWARGFGPNPAKWRAIVTRSLAKLLKEGGGWPTLRGRGGRARMLGMLLREAERQDPWLRVAPHRRTLRVVSGIDVRLCRYLAWYFEHLRAKGPARQHVRTVGAPPWLVRAAEIFVEQWAVCGWERRRRVAVLRAAAEILGAELTTFTRKLGEFYRSSGTDVDLSFEALGPQRLRAPARIPAGKSPSSACTVIAAYEGSR